MKSPNSFFVHRKLFGDPTTVPDQVEAVRTRFGLTQVVLVGDRGMIRTDQKAAAREAEFHFITALTKPQIQKLLADKVLQLELFEEKVHEVFGVDGRRFVLRRNPVRQQEIKRSREQKQQALEAALKKAGVADKDLRTTNFSIWPSQQYGPDGSVTGTIYMVDNTVYVTGTHKSGQGDHIKMFASRDISRL